MPYGSLDAASSTSTDRYLCVDLCGIRKFLSFYARLSLSRKNICSIYVELSFFSISSLSPKLICSLRLAYQTVVRSSCPFLSHAPSEVADEHDGKSLRCVSTMTHSELFTIDGRILKLRLSTLPAVKLNLTSYSSWIINIWSTKLLRRIFSRN